MTEVPKIVHGRLRAAEQNAQEHPHPDADLLAGFAEQALSAAERDSVLEHLALCRDCREMIALALPADMPAAPIAADAGVDHSTLIPEKSKKGWLTSGNFAWPNLRWAALAAGVALAASVLLLHPVKLNQTTLPSAKERIATGPPSPSQSESQLAESQLAESKTLAMSADQLAVLPKTATDEKRLQQPQSSKKQKFNAGRATSQPSGKLIGNNLKSSADTSEALKSETQAKVTHTANEAVETSATSISTPVPSPEGTLVAQADAPAIEKAKPALDSELGSQQESKQDNSADAYAMRAKSRTANTLAGAKVALPGSQNLPHATWIITAGILQRSLDSGQSWQDVLRARGPLACFASRNQDVWAGGQAGALFHSTDSGLTWVQVQPSVNTQQLTGDVTNIDLGEKNSSGNSHSAITVSTATNEVWRSVDNGQTWSKQ